MVVPYMHIPLAFHVPPTWPAHMDPPALDYLAETYKPAKGGTAQKNLEGRTVLRPDIDLNDYRCRAEIDFLVIRHVTKRRERAYEIWLHLRAFLKGASSPSSVFVSGPTGWRNYVGTDFRIRIQRPQPAGLPRLLEALAKRYPIEASACRPGELTMLEVSVDFYAKHRTGMPDEEVELRRWRLVEVLRRHFRADPRITDCNKGRPRTIWAEMGRGKKYLVDEKLDRGDTAKERAAKRFRVRKADAIALHLKAHHFGPLDGTLYFGPKAGFASYRIMDKVTDRRDPSKGTVDQLPLKERRARIEITLRKEVSGAGQDRELWDRFGLEVAQDLYGFPFKDLRKKAFEFYLPTVGPIWGESELPFTLDASDAEVFCCSGCHGLFRFHSALFRLQEKMFMRGKLSMQPPLLNHKGRLVSYESLNQKVVRSLDGLSRAWSS